ncbi:hypothetical protein BKA24_001785 [Microbacterium marinum]|uniref:4Fe-4S Wbl-type domain-containing protein n=1 Tax=Microbacterium marinum TaxID=421115 RepID=A0A7W7BQP9_9MICO|nr:WhiB family transcriptional regulator [Microbacterium marinum]MBB4667076.1 hypothetical protein [Microbacterium marinum]
MRPPREPLPGFTAALELANEKPAAPQPYCAGSGPAYADYVTPPSAEVARQMCAPCPLMELCRASALHEKPAWGVHGGIAWVNGRQWHLRRTAEMAITDDLGELQVVELDDDLDEELEVSSATLLTP